MKRILLIGAVLMVFLSPAVFAEEHADEALKQTKIAIEYG
jgi:hypothetical protein